jgi:hypothetical protein
VTVHPVNVEHEFDQPVRERRLARIEHGDPTSRNCTDPDRRQDF